MLIRFLIFNLIISFKFLNKLLLFGKTQKSIKPLSEDPQKRALILSLAIRHMEPSMITRQRDIIRTPM